MRQASTWVGCLVLVCSLGCRGSAPPPADAAAAVATTPTPGCSGGACTITLNESNGQCSVLPNELPIDSSNTVTFVTEVSMQTAAVLFSQKTPSAIRFQNGRPSQIDRGQNFAAGQLTGMPGDAYEYAVRFVGQGGFNCTIDPVICIKGGLDPLQDTCD